MQKSIIKKYFPSSKYQPRSGITKSDITGINRKKVVIIFIVHICLKLTEEKLRVVDNNNQCHLKIDSLQWLLCNFFFGSPMFKSKATIFLDNELYSELSCVKPMKMQH